MERSLLSHIKPVWEVHVPEPWSASCPLLQGQVYDRKPPVVATGLTKGRDLEDFRSTSPPTRQGWEENCTTVACLKREVFSCCDRNVMVPV